MGTPWNKNAPQCEGKAKTTGNRCLRVAMKERRFCKLHGGAALRGVASPSFKHGRYAKGMDYDLAQRYEQARTDPDLLSLVDEIAVLDLRLTDIVGDVEGSQLAMTWEGLKKTKGRMLAARASEDKAALVYYMNELMDQIEDGGAILAKFYEVSALFEQRRKLVDTERKHREASKLNATIEEQMYLVARLAGIIKKYVTDQKQLQSISDELIELINPISSRASITAGN